MAAALRRAAVRGDTRCHAAARASVTGGTAAAAEVKEGVGGPFFAAPRAAQIKQPLDKK